MFPGVGELLKHVSPESLAILANLGQHLKQAEDPKDELLRLLRVLDKHLDPSYRLEAKPSRKA
jgi:hypothetical protein